MTSHWRDLGEGFFTEDPDATLDDVKRQFAQVCRALRNQPVDTTVFDYERKPTL
jgi:hypothetical protein